MRTIALVAAVVAAATLTAAVPASTPTLWPHAYDARISGATPAVLNGTWRISIQRTAYTVAKGGSLAVVGTLQIQGNRVTFHDLAGAFACGGAQAVGSYTWAIHGTRLTLTKLSDACAGRRAILARTFTRVV